MASSSQVWKSFGYFFILLLIIILTVTAGMMQKNSGDSDSSSNTLSFVVISGFGVALTSLIYMKAIKSAM